MLDACLAERECCLHSYTQVFVTPVPHFWNTEIDNSSWLCVLYFPIPLHFEETSYYTYRCTLNSTFPKYRSSGIRFFVMLRCIGRLLTADLSKESSALLPERWRWYDLPKRRGKIRVKDLNVPGGLNVHVSSMFYTAFWKTATSKW